MNDKIDTKNKFFYYENRDSLQDILNELRNDENSKKLSDIFHIYMNIENEFLKLLQYAQLVRFYLDEKSVSTDRLRDETKYIFDTIMTSDEYKKLENEQEEKA